MSLMLNQLDSAASDEADAVVGTGRSPTLLIPPTDGERLMRFRRYRDEAAFAEVVEAHAKMVWGVCAQILRHQQDIEDAFQATFLILARKASSIRAADSAAGWLYRVAFRTALLARDRRSRRHEAPLTEDPRSLDDQLAAVEQSEQSLALLEELNALPPRYRQPLVLCYMEGRTRREAADVMGVTSQTVKGLLARGTRMLRSRLVRRGAALSTSMAAVAAAMNASSSAAAPALVSSTTALSAGFALKMKLSAYTSQGASLKGVAACALAEQGIIAMTIAAASKPAVGLLGICLAVGMLAIADAKPAKELAIAGDADRIVLVSTDVDEGSADESAQDVPVATTIAAEEEEESVSEKGVIDVAITSGEPTLSVGQLKVGGAAASAAPTSPTPPTPPAGVVEDVLVTSEVPLQVPAVQPQRQYIQLARPPVFQFTHGQPAAPVVNFTNAPAAGGASKAMLKLEGEYWALKIEGLEKKARALEIKAERAQVQMEQGLSALNEGDIVELNAERDLTLAEVKLCEMNAQRVHESLQELQPLKEEGRQAAEEMRKAERAAAQEARRVAESEARESESGARAAASLPAAAPNPDVVALPREEYLRLLKLAEQMRQLGQELKPVYEEDEVEGQLQTQ